MTYNLFIGRWSPFHEGHKYLINSFLNNGKKVCIAVRDTPINMKNPFSAELRKKRIEKIYKNNSNVKVIIIPDVEQVITGRGVGYSVVQAPDNIQMISGTEIRKQTTDTFNNGKGLLVWIYGLPCSGKTTLGDSAEDILSRILERDVQRLDGDIVRKSMCSDLGFSKEDRIENIHRMMDLAEILVNHGIIVIASFITPYSESRIELRKRFGDKLLLIHINASKATCEIRDVKGMWAKARRGEIKNFTGVDDPFEMPDKVEGAISLSGTGDVKSYELVRHIGKWFRP